MAEVEGLSEFYRFFWLFVLFVFGFLLTGIVLAGSGTEYIDFITNKAPFLVVVPFIILAIEWVAQDLFGISLFALGSSDEDTYVLQKLFGYFGAFAVATIGSIAFSIFLFYSITQLNVNYVYTPEVTSRYQVFAEGLEFIASTTDPGIKSFLDGLIPFVVEDSYYIYFPIFFLWIIPMLLLRKFGGLDNITSTLIGMVIWLTVTSIVIFPSVHFKSYQAIEGAYNRATSFTMVCGIMTGLTGFPACSMPHFFNNFFSSHFQIVGYGKTIQAPLTQIPVQ